MPRLFKTSAVAALAALALPAFAAGAQAMPGGLASAAPAVAGDAATIILASGGCGPYRHRGYNGYCYPGGGYRGGYGYGYRPYYRPYGYGYGYGYRRFGFY